MLECTGCIYLVGPVIVHIAYLHIILLFHWLNSVKPPSFILKPACFMLKPPFFTRSAAGEILNHPPRINPHSSLAQVCNMVVPVSGRICATSLDFGPFCLGQRKMLSPKFSALACWWLSIAQPSAHWNTFNCLYCLNRELAILGCWTAIARDPESILLCSYDHIISYIWL